MQEKGISAIWEYVQSQLSNLWQTLLSAAMQWVTETLVTKGLVKLATFLDPTGIMAVVNSCIAIVDAINSAVEYARELLEIVDRYVSTIASVARGDVEPGAAMVERGFASAIPVALGFLAPQVGLGNLPDEIAKIVGKLRGLVDQAVTWVIDQAWKLGKAAIDATGARPEGGAWRSAGATTAGATRRARRCPAWPQRRLPGPARRLTCRTIQRDGAVLALIVGEPKVGSHSPRARGARTQTGTDSPQLVRLAARPRRPGPTLTGPRPGTGSNSGTSGRSTGAASRRAPTERHRRGRTSQLELPRWGWSGARVPASGGRITAPASWG